MSATSDTQQQRLQESRGRRACDRTKAQLDKLDPLLAGHAARRAIELADPAERAVLLQEARHYLDAVGVPLRVNEIVDVMSRTDPAFREVHELQHAAEQLSSRVAQNASIVRASVGELHYVEYLVADPTPAAWREPDPFAQAPVRSHEAVTQSGNDSKPADAGPTYEELAERRAARLAGAPAERAAATPQDLAS